MKTIIYLVLAVACSATDFILTNHTTENVAFGLTNEVKDAVVYVGPLETKTVNLTFYPTYFYTTGVNLSMATPNDEPAYEWCDTVMIQLVTADSGLVTILPGWDWFQVAEKCFWAFCAYYVAKFFLRAGASLWRMPEP